MNKEFYMDWEEYYQEGCDSYDDGLELSENPYSGWRAEAWKLGWKDSENQKAWKLKE